MCARWLETSWRHRQPRRAGRRLGGTPPLRLVGLQARGGPQPLDPQDFGLLVPAAMGSAPAWPGAAVE